MGSVAHLIPIVRGPRTESGAIHLTRPVTLLGRHEGCDVVLSFRAVSRRHCCVIQVDREWWVRDLDSRHGTHVNGAAVRERRLETGDELAVGPLIYRVEILGAGGV